MSKKGPGRPPKTPEERTKPFSMRLTARVHCQLAKLAERTRLPKTTIIIIALERHLAENGLWSKGGGK